MRLFSRERSESEARSQAKMLRGFGASAKVNPEISNMTRHATGYYQVWTDYKPRKRKR